MHFTERVIRSLLLLGYEVTEENSASTSIMHSLISIMVMWWWLSPVTVEEVIRVHMHPCTSTQAANTSRTFPRAPGEVPMAGYTPDLRYSLSVADSEVLGSQHVTLGCRNSLSLQIDSGGGGVSALTQKIRFVLLLGSTVRLWS